MRKEEKKRIAASPTTDCKFDGENWRATGCRIPHPAPALHSELTELKPGALPIGIGNRSTYNVTPYSFSPQPQQWEPWRSKSGSWTPTSSSSTQSLDLLSLLSNARETNKIRAVGLAFVYRRSRRERRGDGDDYY